MSNDKFENGGALFPLTGDRRTEKGPTLDGKLSIDGDLAAYVLDQLSRKGTVEIRLAAWKRMGKSNQQFLSLQGDIPWADNPRNPKATGAVSSGVQAAAAQPVQQRPVMDDEIPFN